MICLPPNKINLLKRTVLTEKVIRKKEKSNCNNTKDAQCSSKREHKQISSHESEIE